jgi:hypothetical protein
MIGGLAALALLGAGTGAAWAESAAEIAVREAKQYAGTEINVIWEAGLQSLEAYMQWASKPAAYPGD